MVFRSEPQYGVEFARDRFHEVCGGVRCAWCETRRSCYVCRAVRGALAIAGPVSDEVEDEFDEHSFPASTGETLGKLIPEP
jgi:hypothetical protein